METFHNFYGEYVDICEDFSFYPNIEIILYLHPIIINWYLVGGQNVGRKDAKIVTMKMQVGAAPGLDPGLSASLVLEIHHHT